MNLLEILGQFLGIFVELIPRFARRPDSTEWLVVDAFLRGPMICRNRPVLYVPVFDSVEYWPRNEEPVNTEMQSLTTSEGESVTVDTGFSYRISDPLKTRSMVAENYVIKAVMITRGEVRELVGRNYFEELSCVSTDSEEMVHTKGNIDSLLKEYGLSLTYFCIEDCCLTRNLRHFGVSVTNSTFTSPTG